MRSVLLFILPTVSAHIYVMSFLYRKQHLIKLFNKIFYIDMFKNALISGFETVYMFKVRLMNNC